MAVIRLLLTEQKVCKPGHQFVIWHWQRHSKNLRHIVLKILQLSFPPLNITQRILHPCQLVPQKLNGMLADISFLFDIISSSSDLVFQLSYFPVVFGPQTLRFYQTFLQVFDFSRPLKRCYLEKLITSKRIVIHVIISFISFHILIPTYQSSRQWNY